MQVLHFDLSLSEDNDKLYDLMEAAYMALPLIRFTIHTDRKARKEYTKKSNTPPEELPVPIG